MTTKLWYLSHPYGGVTENLDKARRWVRFLREEFGAAVWAPWIQVCEALPETPENIKRGLDIDCKMIDASDGIILVGGWLSAGMGRESWYARRIGRAELSLIEFREPADLIGSEAYARAKEMLGS